MPGAAFVGADDIAVDACWADPRRVEPGSLFVALEETGRDSHRSIGEALRRGCGAVLSQHSAPEISVPSCFVPDVWEAYGRLCHALAANPSRQMKIIGVAGAGDKTVLSCLIASILNLAGNKIGVLGRLGCLDGHEVCSSVRTIPPADQLADVLARMVANGCSHAVLDVSAAAIGKRRAEGVQFDAVCLAGPRRIRHTISDPLGNDQGSRPRLLNYLAPEGFVVIDADAPGSARYLSQIDGPVLTVGLRSAAEITARIVERSAAGQVFLLAAGSEAMPVRTSMIGTRHVRCCLMAAAVGLAYGIELVKIVQGLEAVDYVPGRLQRIDCGQPFGVFIDDAHTPNALAAALKTLRAVASGRLICVLAPKRAIETLAPERAVPRNGSRISAPLPATRREAPSRGPPCAASSADFIARPRQRLCPIVWQRSVGPSAGRRKATSCCSPANAGQRRPMRDAKNEYLMIAKWQGSGCTSTSGRTCEQMAMNTLHDLHEAIGGNLKPPVGVGADLDAVPLGPVVTDSRDVVPGSLFWALPGEHHDGAEFAVEAFDRGAAGVVVNRPVDPPEDRWAIEVKDVHGALWNWAGWNRRHFSGTVIAVTGSVGKTTTRQMIHTVLASRFRGAPIPRNDVPRIGLALNMLRMERSHHYAVVELHGETRGEIGRLAELCRPQIGVVTQVADGHAGELERGLEIAELQGELLSALPSAGVAVLGDDPMLRRVARSCRAPVIWVGRGTACDITASDVQWDHGVLNFTLSGCFFHVPIWGRHHLGSALVAVAVGRSMGLDLEQIAEALACFASVPSRCKVLEIRGATIITDSSAATPAAMRAALELLRDFDAPGRKIVVCGDMGEVDRNGMLTHRRLGSEVVTVCGADMLIACGDYASDVVAAARVAGMSPSRTIACRTSDEALPYLGQAILPGDVVLVERRPDTCDGTRCRGAAPLPTAPRRLTKHREEETDCHEPLRTPPTAPRLRESGGTLPPGAGAILAGFAASGSAVPVSASRWSPGLAPGRRIRAAPVAQGFPATTHGPIGVGVRWRKSRGPRNV